MRRSGLLTSQRGTAVLDAVVAIGLLMILALGTIQVGLTVYAHNAVSASAYEGARAAAEIGTSTSDARDVAAQMVHATVGGLLESPHISVSITDTPAGELVRVVVAGRQRALGPIPVRLPVTAEATSVRETPPS